jgi:6-phosphogluconolactonase
VTSLTTCADALTAARRGALEIARRLDGARRERGLARLALSGGNAPARAYRLLAGELDSWEDIEVWFVDERCVPPDHADSNYRLAEETLLSSAAGLIGERVRRIEGELGPEQGAQRYSEELRAISMPGELPVIDLIVLGIGPDGHIASLFPGAATLDAGEAELCLAVSDAPKPPPERITLSLSMLHAARRCVLLASGAGEADALSAMLGEPSRHVPASLLRRGRLSVIADDAASPAPVPR